MIQEIWTDYITTQATIDIRCAAAIVIRGRRRQMGCDCLSKVNDHGIFDVLIH
jgi:hypothetical protein